MRSRYSFILLIVIVAAALFVPTVLAGQPPAIYSVSEGKDPGTDRPTLSIAGKGLTRFVSFQLAEAGTAVPHGSPDVLSRKSTLLVLRLSADLLPGAYVLTVADRKGVGVDLAVSIGNGRPLPGSVGSESLDPALLADLRDAGSLTGTLSTAQFSAYADLAAEGKVGSGASQVAAGDHLHDDRYPTKADLGATGNINTGTNPVDWSQLKGVPAGLADGTDNVDATWTTSGSDVYRSSGRVGVGTTTPAAELHVTADRGVLFDKGGGSSAIPIEGGGIRMMWYPGKAAFRAGLVSSTWWNDTNIGITSVALGSNCMASGASSFAVGTTTKATGDAALATGSGTTASGVLSTAMGDQTTAPSYLSVAMGVYNVATGSAGSVSPTDSVLMVGNGTLNVPFNSLTLLRNGNLTISGTLTQNSDLRMKKDVVPLTAVLPRLAGIRAVSYEFKDTTRSPEGRQIGLVAQEVQAAFPELVREDTQGTLSVSYQNFSAVLLEAVKEQQATIETRDREVAALKAKVADTDARLARLEALLSAEPARGKGR